MTKMAEVKQVFLITGSSGFLGHALAHHFGSRASTIIGFDLEGPPYPPPSTDVLFCDLTSDESVQKTFHLVRSRYGAKIRAVFHLAAYYSFSGEDSPLYRKVTVEGTERMLRELQAFDVGQFIFSSSMLVHKPNEHGDLISEESPIDPTWQYPQSKVETEELIHDVHGDIPVINLRIAGVYDDDCHSIPISHQIQRIYEKQLESYLYSGDTSVKQSYVHIADVVKAFECALDHANELPKEATFLIGEPDAMSYKEIQDEIGMRIHGEEWLTVSVPKPIAKVGAYVESAMPGNESFVKPWMIDRADDSYELNIEKARRLLGWEPQYRLRQALPEIIARLVRDPVSWYRTNKLNLPDELKDQEQSKHS